MVISFCDYRRQVIPERDGFIPTRCESEPVPFSDEGGSIRARDRPTLAGPQDSASRQIILWAYTALKKRQWVIHQISRLEHGTSITFQTASRAFKALGITADIVTGNGLRIALA